MKFRGWFEGSDELMRKIITRIHGLTKDQQEMEEYDRCYSCQLFNDRYNRWDIKYDQLGNYIPQDMRKPLYHDPIGKEIIDTVSSFVFGTDKFPSIVFKTFKDIYPNHDLIKRAIENGELKEEKVNKLNEYQKNKLKINLADKKVCFWNP